MAGTISLPTGTSDVMSGLEQAQRINTALRAVVTKFAGPTAPTAAQLGLDSLANVEWTDTSATTYVVKVRNSADNAWIVVGYIDQIGTQYIPAGTLRPGNNLADIASAAAARTNLGVYSVSQVDALVAAGGGTFVATAGEAINPAPKLVYKDIFNQRGGGASRWYLVDTDATAPVRISPVIGIAIGSAAGAGSSFTCQVQQGQVSGFTGLTADAAVWASGTAGALTQTAPAIPGSGAQNVVRMIGYAINATTVMFQPYRDTVFQARNSALAHGASVTIEHFPDSGARERMAAAYVAVMDGTSYSNTGGSGDRTGIITVTTTATIDAGTISAIVNGSTSDNAVDLGTGTGTQSADGKVITFDFGAGASKTVDEVKLYMSIGALSGSFKWQWATSAAPSVWNDAATFTGANVALQTVVIAGAYGFRYLRLVGQSGSLFTNQFLCEVEFKIADGVPASRDEPVTIGSESINGGANDRVTVKFSDTANANQDTKTTFYNRTNATRDLIVEVVL